MKNIYIIFAFFIFNFMFGTPVLAQDCKPVAVGDYGWSASIRYEGLYCLKQDIRQSVGPAWLRLPHQPTPQSPLMMIGSNNVKLDLGGHALRATQKTGQGLWVNASRDDPIHSIHVSNGSIRTTDRPAVVMVHAWNDNNDRFRRRFIAPYLATARDVSEYKETGFVLENMTLEANDVVVIMQGKNNTIRHCKIIGGNATINLYGPGLTFEDNDIVMNASEDKPNGEGAVMLYLEDAEGSIIRNNRFTLRGRVVDAEAVVLKNSANVTLQGNSVNGGKQTFKLLDQASSVKVE